MAAMSNDETPRPSKRYLRWIEWGLYAVAAACLLVFAVQWYRYRQASQPLEPTGKVLAELESRDRIPRERGSAADCNVLVITMDTTRADYLGCYGHPGVQTPVIDQLARQGVLFANAFTPSPSTLPGHCSIFTGLYPYHHGARANGTFHLGPQNTTLAEILKGNGYRTAAFIAAYVLNGRFGLDQGFDLYDDDLSKGVQYSDHSFRERPAQYVNDAALNWLQTVKDERFFAWIHYFDPHAPYIPPEPFRTSYAENLYAGEIAYTDLEIGRLLKGLNDLGVLENTLIVLAADHGEGLGEHAEATHSLLIYDSTLHTPLIFVLPGNQSIGAVVERQVSNVDIVPTILDLLAIDAGASFDGVCLLGGPETHDRSIYVETISTLVLHGWSPLFGIRQQNAKYIHAPRPELYDLGDDPKETNNVLKERPEQAVVLAGILDQHVGDDLYGADALAQMVTMDPETKRKMEALGYVGTVRGQAVDPRIAAMRDPKDMVPHWERSERAINNMAVGKFRQGLSELEACIEVVPDDVWTLRLLAAAYLEAGEVDRAEAMALRALELEKNEPGVYVLLGRVSAARRQVEVAEGHYRQALQVDPRFAHAYVALGALYAQAAGPEKALEYFQQAIEMDPGTAGPPAHNAIGYMHFGRLDLGPAREAFRKALEIDELNGNAHNGLASVLIAEGELAEAEEELKIAVRFLPNDVRVLSTLAGLHNKRQEYQQAIGLARRALDVNADYIPALNSLGSALRGIGDLDRAVEAFEKALDRDPSYVPCIINLAQVYRTQDREEKAAELYDRALQINPNQPMALFNLGTYKVTRSRYEEALDLYRRALAVDPDYALAHRQLGWLLLTRGETQQALMHLERSLELEPDQQDRERLLTVVETLRELPEGTTQPAVDYTPSDLP